MKKKHVERNVNLKVIVELDLENYKNNFKVIHISYEIL